MAKKLKEGLYTDGKTVVFVRGFWHSGQNAFFYKVLPYERLTHQLSLVNFREKYPYKVDRVEVGA